jgi:nitrogen fixation protein NifQ
MAAITAATASPLPAQGAPEPVALARERRAVRGDEVDDLVALLLDHAPAGADGDLRELAERVAVGCLGDNHLWQDLQLPSRRELSALFDRWFPALATKNRGDMKWKKFLYKQLCDREAVRVCVAPSCEVCADYAKCFGPEE